MSGSVSIRIAGADPGFSEGGIRIRSYMGYLILLSTKTSDNERLQCFELRKFIKLLKRSNLKGLGGVVGVNPYMI